MPADLHLHLQSKTGTQPDHHMVIKGGFFGPIVASLVGAAAPWLLKKLFGGENTGSGRKRTHNVHVKVGGMVMQNMPAIKVMDVIHKIVRSMEHAEGTNKGKGTMVGTGRCKGKGTMVGTGRCKGKGIIVGNGKLDLGATSTPAVSTGSGRRRKKKSAAGLSRRKSSSDEER